MATLEQLETALRNADAAGDVAAARQLAAAYRAAQADERPTVNLRAIENQMEPASRLEAAKLRESEIERVTGLTLPPAFKTGVMALGHGILQLPMGVRQAFGIGTAEDRDLMADAKAARDSSVTNQALGIAGEIIPTLAIPAGPAVRAGSAAVRGAAGAGRVLGTNAAIGGAEYVDEGEDRATNAAFGAAGAAAGAAGGELLKRAMVARRGGIAANNAGRKLAEEITQAGGDPNAVIALLRASKSKVPLTAAQASGNPTLARAELASRRDLPDSFAEFDKTQREGVQGMLDRATRTADDVDALKAARDAEATPLREAALAGAAGDLTSGLKASADDLMARSVPGSPQRKLANLTQDVLGESPDAAKLYEYRKLLASKLAGPAALGDDVSAVVKGAERETKALIAAIDETLERASGGKWNEYLDAYKGASRGVNSAQAAGKVREALEANAERGNKVTANRLKAALTKAQSRKFGERFVPETSGEFAEALGTLRQIEAPGRLIKDAGTMGGGSQTAMQLAAREFAPGALGVGAAAYGELTGSREATALGALGVLVSGKRVLSHVQHQALAQVLRDPQAMANTLEAGIRAGVPAGVLQQAINKAAAQIAQGGL